MGTFGYNYLGPKIFALFLLKSQKKFWFYFCLYFILFRFIICDLFVTFVHLNLKYWVVQTQYLVFFGIVLLYTEFIKTDNLFQNTQLLERNLKCLLLTQNLMTSCLISEHYLFGFLNITVCHCYWRLLVINKPNFV